MLLPLMFLLPFIASGGMSLPRQDLNMFPPLVVMGLRLRPCCFFSASASSSRRLQTVRELVASGAGLMMLLLRSGLFLGSQEAPNSLKHATLREH